MKPSDVRKPSYVSSSLADKDGRAGEERPQDEEGSPWGGATPAVEPDTGRIQIYCHPCAPGARVSHMPDDREEPERTNQAIAESRDADCHHCGRGHGEPRSADGEPRKDLCCGTGCNERREWMVRNCMYPLVVHRWSFPLGPGTDPCYATKEDRCGHKTCGGCGGVERFFGVEEVVCAFHRGCPPPEPVG